MGETRVGTNKVVSGMACALRAARGLGLWVGLGVSLGASLCASGAWAAGAEAKVPRQAAQPPAPQWATVVAVHDGDSVRVLPFGASGQLTLRLSGLDAPELCQAGGLAARDVLRQRIAGQLVWVEISGRDDYGRWLAQLQHQGEDLGPWLVSSGWAWSYRRGPRPGRYDGLEAAARQQRRGVFADPLAEEPRAFRRRHGPCQRATWAQTGQSS